MHVHLGWYNVAGTLMYRVNKALISFSIIFSRKTPDFLMLSKCNVPTAKFPRDTEKDV